MYSEDTDIYGISINQDLEYKKDMLPPLTRIDYIADSIGYVASNLNKSFFSQLKPTLLFFLNLNRIKQNLLGRFKSWLYFFS